MREAVIVSTARTGVGKAYRGASTTPRPRFYPPMWSMPRSRARASIQRASMTCISASAITGIRRATILAA